MKVDDIKVDGRFRKDLGDVAPLASSIKKIGLLHPVVVTPDGKLIAGQRRLEAFRLLGRDTIPATVVDLENVLLGECHENTVRKDFLPSEAVAVWKAVQEFEREKARERLRDAGSLGGKGCGKLPQASKGKSRDKAARGIGMSGRTAEKAAAIVEAAEAEPEKFAPLVEEMDRTGRVAGAYKKLVTQKKEQAKERAIVAVDKERERNIDSICDLRVCTCSELFSSGIRPDAVITDPPYGLEHLSVFSELAQACAKAHVKTVAVMSGQAYLPEVMSRLSEHMAYRWTLAYLTPGGQSVQIWPTKVNTFWKPVLLFGESEEWIGDVARSKTNDNDKRFHNWGQSESGMADLIERLTKPGQLVCDPFLGGGTTAVCCLAIGRRFVGCDISKTAVETTRKRIKDSSCEK